MTRPGVLYRAESRAALIVQDPRGWTARRRLATSVDKGIRRATTGKACRGEVQGVFLSCDCVEQAYATATPVHCPGKAVHCPRNG